MPGPSRRSHRRRRSTQCSFGDRAAFAWTRPAAAAGFDIELASAAGGGGRAADREPGRPGRHAPRGAARARPLHVARALARGSRRRHARPRAVERRARPSPSRRGRRPGPPAERTPRTRRRSRCAGPPVSPAIATVSSSPATPSSTRPVVDVAGRRAAAVDGPAGAGAATASASPSSTRKGRRGRSARCRPSTSRRSRRRSWWWLLEPIAVSAAFLVAGCDGDPLVARSSRARSSPGLAVAATVGTTPVARQLDRWLGDLTAGLVAPALADAAGGSIVFDVDDRTLAELTPLAGSWPVRPRRVGARRRLSARPRRPRHRPRRALRRAAGRRRAAERRARSRARHGGGRGDRAVRADRRHRQRHLDGRARLAGAGGRAGDGLGRRRRRRVRSCGAPAASPSSRCSRTTTASSAASRCCIAPATRCCRRLAWRPWPGGPIRAAVPRSSGRRRRAAASSALGDRAFPVDARAAPSCGIRARSTG